MGSPYGQSKDWVRTGGQCFVHHPDKGSIKCYVCAAGGHSPPTSPSFIAYDWNYFQTLYMKILSYILKKQVLAHWLEVSACKYHEE